MLYLRVQECGFYYETFFHRKNFVFFYFNGGLSPTPSFAELVTSFILRQLLTLGSSFITKTHLFSEPCDKLFISDSTIFDGLFHLLVFCKMEKSSIAKMAYINTYCRIMSIFV